MPTIEYSNNPNSETVFVTDGGKRTRALKKVLLNGTIDYPQNANAKDCYVTVDGKKQRALMTVDISSAGTLEYPDGSNSTKGYVTDGNGNKHHVVLTANIASGSTPFEKYKLLDRVKDDTDTEIGTVVGFHTDSNNNTYAVVCLDKCYRTNSSYLFGLYGIAISDLPTYNASKVFDAKETATFNCDKILAQATASEVSSPAVEYCRGLSFVIDGTTYYGQLPTVNEIIYILSNLNWLNTNDTSTGTDLGSGNVYMASSCFSNANYIWTVGGTSATILEAKMSNTGKKIIPIIELPI